jgi:hypothetical protein
VVRIIIVSVIFFWNISNLVVRVRAIKLNPSASWFIEIKKLLLKYELQDPIFMLDNPITKKEWKSILNRKINV